MAVSYKTPGVYIAESNDISLSIPNVATSVPAFFGVAKVGGSATPRPQRITSFFDFQSKFGKPDAPTWTVTDLGESLQIAGDPHAALPVGPALLYYAVQWYFLNGGGPCYVVATADTDLPQFQSGLDALATVDAPTLIVPCGAMGLAADAYHSFCKRALAQARSLRDRFCILDVRMANAAFHDEVARDLAGFRSGLGVDHLDYGAAYYPHVQSSLAWEYEDDAITYAGAPLSAPSNKAALAKVTAWLRTLRVTLPPSAAVAGVYATVDLERGVWKAPANVGLQYALKPVVSIDDDEQSDMNHAGDKAQVNAIRFFSNKGTLVWGARTLDYQSADWTYISVRRLFIMLEESISKAISAFVFEANDRSTWTNVKAAIDSYLYQMWSQGALVGSKPAEAYDVQVGLGQTMTPDDVREGRMIIDVRVAPVRPAEFIIISFSQNVKGA